MRTSILPNGAVKRYGQGGLAESSQNPLKITVMGADLTQQTFIQEAVSTQRQLTFLSFQSLRAAMLHGTFSGKGLLLFLVPAEHRLAVQQVRIMKWIMTRQPGLNLIPLIPGRAVWDAMREPLAKHFPIYLPINFANTSADSFASRLRDCVTLHFPGIFEALANPVLNNEAMPEQMQKLNTQVQVKLAELSKQVLQLEQKLAIAEKNVAVQKPATSGFSPRAAVTGSQWGGDRYLLA